MDFKYFIWYALMILFVSYSSWAVYEARGSDDVDFFLAHNPEENGALMFYDPNQEKSDKSASDRANAIISVFKNIGEEGRSEEDWVNQLNDKVHLMRIDATNVDNARTVKEYKIAATPLLILLDYGKIILMEQLTDKSVDHVKDLLMTQLEQKKKAAAKKKAADAATAKSSANSPDGQSAELKSAQKAADDALKALEDLRKTFEQHLAVEKAQKDVEEAKKKANEAQKKLEEATKDLNKSKSDAKTADSKSGKTNKPTDGDKWDDDNKAGNQQPKVQIQYVPVYTTKQPSTTTIPTTTTSRKTYPSSYWSVVDSGRR